MARFAYTARDRAGQTVSATLEAPSRKDALRVIASRGLQPLRVNEDSPAAAKAAAGGGARSLLSRPAARPGRSLRLPFLQALHDLTTSGLSAGEAVRLLAQRIKEPALRGLCASLWERFDSEHGVVSVCVDLSVTEGFTMPERPASTAPAVAAEGDMLLF